MHVMKGKEKIGKKARKMTQGKEGKGKKTRT